MSDQAATTTGEATNQGVAPQAGQRATTPHPDFTRPPAGPPAPAPPPAAPQTIPLPIDDYQRYRDIERQLGEMQAAQAAAIEEKEQARLQALADKGKVQEALEEQRKSWETKHSEAMARYSTLEGQIAQERKANVLADGLAGRNFIGNSPEEKATTAAMVKRLLQDDFEVVRDANGAFVVRDKVSGRPAADAMKERLDSPQFALFFAASSGGGSGTDGTRPAPANGNQGDAIARTLADFGVAAPHANTGLSFK